MKSYASIDRVENEWSVCEVEMIPVEESNVCDFFSKETEMIDISLNKIIESVGEIQEGDILVIEHDGENASIIYEKDDEEKQRRIALLQKMIG